MAEQEQALTEQILADARKRAAEIEQNADAEGQRIRAEALRKAEAAVQGALEDARARAARREEIARAHTQQEIRKLRLQRRQELLDYARAEVEKRLAHLAAVSEHRAALRKLALAAIEAMNGESFEIVLRAEDRRALGDRLASEVSAAAKQSLHRDVEVALAEAPLEATGGLIVRSADGHQVADQTFDGRLMRLWEEIRGEIVAMLPDVGATA